jgi:hypothetical protein
VLTASRDIVIDPQAAHLLELTRHNDRRSPVYVNVEHIILIERAKDDIETLVWLADAHGTVLHVEETPGAIAWAMRGA